MYKTQIKELLDEKGKLITKLRSIIDLTEREKRDLRADEKSESDKISERLDAIEDRISTMERAMEGEEEEKEDDREEDGKAEKDDKEDRSTKIVNGKRVVQLPEQRSKPQVSKGVKLPERRDGEDDSDYNLRCRRSSVAYLKAFVRYVLHGERGLHSSFEKRDVQADIDFVGGFLIMPQQFVSQLIKFTDNLLWIRQLATKFTLPNAQSLGAPVLDTDPDDSDWTNELATGNVDNAFAVGKRELVPFPIAKRLKASNKLLRMANVSSTFSVYDAESGLGPIENFLMSRLAYKTAVPQEKAFLTGSGVAQPLGVFTASTRGISTGRDVSTGSTTGITSDGLISAKYTLKQQYHKTARWLWSREAVKRIRQLKDSYGQYLWQPGLQLGQPDMLLEMPLMMSEYVPTTFTNGSYVGMLGDFSFYWIADSLNYQIQKLVELYAEANQTGFIVRAEVDGMPVLEEAFARIVCGS